MYVSYSRSTPPIPPHKVREFTRLGKNCMYILLEQNYWDDFKTTKAYKKDPEKSTTFKKYIKIPKSDKYNAFMKFCKKRGSPESLSFYTICVKIEEADTYKYQMRLLEVARDDYVKVNSAMEVNLSSGDRNELLRLLKLFKKWKDCLGLDDIEAWK